MDSGKLPADVLQRLLAGTRPDPSILIGPAYGEDAAAVRVGGRVIVAASDPVTFATDRIGYYAVTVNANDIAVHGGVPRYFLATILLPLGSGEPDAERVFEQIRGACGDIGVFLIGGHTEVTPAVDRIVVCGTMLGETGEECLVRTSGARVGDLVVLIGGVALEGAAILAREAADDLRRYGLSRETIDRAAAFLDDPGLNIAQQASAIVRAGLVTSMHDPTEGGLASALQEVAGACGHGIRVNAKSIYVWPECRIICDALGLDPLGLIASGSLLAAIDPASRDDVLQAFHGTGLPADVIGEITEEPGVLFQDGTPLPVFERDEIARYFDQRE